MRPATTKEFLGLSLCLGQLLKEGPGKSSQYSQASRAPCVLYMDMQAQRTWTKARWTLQNPPEPLGLKLLGELSALEVQCSPVPSQSHLGWLSPRHPRAQPPHLHPGPPAAQSGETQVPGAGEPHDQTHDRTRESRTLSPSSISQYHSLCLKVPFTKTLL